MKACRTCGVTSRTVNGECRACYMYRRRHKAERPESVIVRHAVRVWESQVVWARITRL